MYKSMHKIAASSLLLSVSLFSSIASAEMVPYGIQSNLTHQTITDWGFQECSRSGAAATSSFASVVANCQGSYLMMAAWDASLGLYGIAAAGERDVVTAATYNTYTGDDGAASLDNWSNGVNFYRTSSSGSWGFTSIASTALHAADTNLLNGYNATHSAYGTQLTETQAGELARGLSWHVSGTGDFNNGWAYNATGNDHQPLGGGGDDRVFFSLSPTTTQSQSQVNDVHAPVALAGLSLLGLLGLRRRRG